MNIELQHTNLSIRYGDIKLEVLRLSMLEDSKILYDFLHSNPNLKSLWLDNCSFGKLVEAESSSDGIENKGFVPNLKTFKLTNLPCLKDIGFEHDAILQRIESLVLENCPVLKTIVPSKVSVCFTFLTTLEVVECTRMEYVMPLSTAKSLGQLVTMKVINCESLEEIILSDPEAGEESEKEPENIVFKQMKTLELISLKKLTRFCSSKSYTLEFPLLEKLVVSGCPKMERFSREEIKTTPTIMKKVYVVRDEEKRLYWEGGIQATIKHIYDKKKYFEGMDKISASEHSVLEECWKTEEKLDKSWFYSLKTLTLEGCKFESCAIPSSVLRCLKSLKELKVRNCRNITFIFEMNGIKGRFQLEKLALEELPNVTHVWPQPDKQNDRRFNNLQQVTVKSCRKLKALFPVAIATNLRMLEQLELRSCDELLEIVEKDRHGDGGTKSFVFLYLKQLGLYELPQLTHFYHGGFTLVCPELDYLYLFKCNKFRLFQTPQESSHPSIRPALFSKIEDIPKVATISMRSKDTSELNLWLNKSGELGLKYLTELMLALDDDVKNDYSNFPFEILEKTHKLQRVSIINSASLKKILFPSSQNPKFLEHLKCLALHSLFKLRSIGGLEHLETLEELIICQCPLLKTIKGYPSNLKKLKVEACHKLKNLITSSAARTLKHLEDLIVYYCKSLKEIVRKEQGAETATEEIILEQLKSISLEYLESLECFYPVNIVLKLPSLARLKMWACPKMTFFSQRLSHDDPSRKIRVSFYKLYYKECHYHQLNTAVRAQFLNQTYLVLKDYPEMQGKWVGSSGIPVEWSFNYLKYLMVEDCEFLRNAVIPAHLVPLLRKLKNLTVRRCKNVKAIFDVKDTPSEHDDPNKTVTIPLRSIFLEELPILRDVWNNDPKASLNFPSLKKVYVWGCNSIKSLFPASVPRDNLQQLDVRNCGELEEIVVKDEAFTQDASILFPRLVYLVLRGLPKLRSICSGMHSFLDCFAVLKRLYVYRCPMFKVFAADIQYSNPEVEDNFATADAKHSFVSSAPKDIVSNFEELELSKEEVIMIQNKLLSVDLRNLKYLGLNNFNDDESDEFLLDAFLCTNMPLPKLTELQLVDCAFKDIFRPKGPGIDYSKLLSQLKYLEITNLHKLSSIGFEQPWMAPLLQNLETLYILECNRLANLASSSAVSFFYLTQLYVENCAGLKYLFTSSTAKSLGALKRLSISKCESLETVVVHEKRDKPNDMVLFSKLSTLCLNELPQLECFYTGNSTLYFPSLYSSVFFTITKCNKMKTFSHGEVLPKFMHGKIDEVSWYSDLNAAVQKQFEKAIATAPMTYMDLLPTERSLLLLSFVMLGQSANGTLKKKQRRTLELPVSTCSPEYNENTSG
ncbi:hypothetical protein PIB30_044713 [Stylosanthes scabra]|uniref:Disease resistance protein At4g27190-like leucine-rich repeats domain-containing protein n=1 Tax=Stylosanthes scabra TaxID=79078 RepID=A0ABU6UF77_9FABA|nr:hypothetical protein [Stylosanthes scabra]